MLSFKQDPYLWVHLTGLAMLPILLDVCLAGLAVGDPILPVWLEMGILIAVGILPIFWMQWQRPFYIFSLVVLAIKPSKLTDDQRRVLNLFRTTEVRILTILVSIFLAWILWQLYCIAPIAAGVTPFAEFSRWTGLLIAGTAFLASNLFLQVPVSVVRVLLTSNRAFDELVPYKSEQILQNFSLFGFRINHILPGIVSEPPIERQAKDTSTETELEESFSSAELEDSQDIIEPEDSLTETELEESLNSAELEDAQDIIELEGASTETELEESLSSAELNSAELEDAQDIIELEDSLTETELEESLSSAELEDSSTETELEESLNSAELEDAQDTVELKYSSIETELEESLSPAELEESQGTVEMEDSIIETEPERSLSSAEVEDSPTETDLEESLNSGELEGSQDIVEPEDSPNYN